MGKKIITDLTAVYLGPPGTNTHLACMNCLGNSTQTLAVESIQEVFEAVEKEKADYGVVPVENSTEGSVNRTLDMFIDSEVKICGEVLMPVSHDLLSKSGDPQDIRKIYSHPQAFEQCRGWLKENFPDTLLSETGSTARAAQMATEDSNSAAIASSFAARLYSLKVISPRIEDYFHNYTRFLVFGRQFMEKTGRDKTSILFSIPHTPGSLFCVLKPFAEKGINLTKIESRPLKNTPWEYIFFLDFEGHATDRPIREAMVEAERNALFIKLLGSYPKSS